MPRPAKTRVCTETEKRKAEIFNNIDDLIFTGCWDEALDKLEYLFRNAPSLRARVHRKLAYIHFEMKNYQKSLGHLHYIIPTKEVFINRMIIECLLQLENKKRAIIHLANAPLKKSEKRKLLSLILPELKTTIEDTTEELRMPQIALRCPTCTKFLFYTQNKFRCLFCS